MLNDLFKSKGYKTFMKKLFWMAMAVTIVGLFFRIMHYSGNYEMLCAGVGTLIVIGILKVLEKVKGTK